MNKCIRCGRGLTHNTVAARCASCQRTYEDETSIGDSINPIAPLSPLDESFSMPSVDPSPSYDPPAYDPPSTDFGGSGGFDGGGAGRDF